MISIDKNKLRYICLLLFFLGFCLVGARQNIVFAQEEIPIFNQEITYDVYYEVSGCEANCVENVKVLGTILINGISFLLIRTSTFAEKGKEAYIALNSVRAILPTGSARPSRSFGKKIQ